MQFINTLNKYNKKQLLSTSSLSHANPQKRKYKYFFIIPSYNEYNYIHNTLDSIKSQNQKLLKESLVVIVINNSNETEQSICKNNFKTYKSIINARYNFEIIGLDCFSKKFALDKKVAGVGLARKIGMDYCIPFANRDSLFCSIDADTILNSDYLKIVSKIFYNNQLSAAVVNFKHQVTKNKINQAAIIKYERIIKSIARNIHKTGSPYGFVSMGSTIICTLYAYVSVGGMPAKKATEDFYFLQKLAKFRGVYKFKKILVYPSARNEQRVYLGTGYRIKQYEKDPLFQDLMIHQSAYTALKNLYQIINLKWDSSSKEILASIREKNGKLSKYLNSNNFVYKINQIQKNAVNKKQFLNQFHKWFDSFKIYKFLKIYGN